MDVVIEHLKEYYILYAIVVVCLLPLLYLTRRYSLPAIFYTVEITIYLCLMHLVVWLVVNLARWFRENSSMKALAEDGRPMDAPTWQTPLLEFWKRDAYDPSWVVWLEVVAVALIVFAVWRYRPMRVKRTRKRRTFKNETSGRGQTAMRPGGAGSSYPVNRGRTGKGR